MTIRHPAYDCQVVLFRDCSSRSRKVEYLLQQREVPYKALSRSGPSHMIPALEFCGEVIWGAENIIRSLGRVCATLEKDQ